MNWVISCVFVWLDGNCEDRPAGRLDRVLLESAIADQVAMTLGKSTNGCLSTHLPPSLWSTQLGRRVNELKEKTIHAFDVSVRRIVSNHPYRLIWSQLWLTTCLNTNQRTNINSNVIILWLIYIVMRVLEQLMVAKEKIGSMQSTCT